MCYVLRDEPYLVGSEYVVVASLSVGFDIFLF